MRSLHKIVATVLALCVLAVFPATRAGAAAPAVTVDETAYLTLDYYGAPDHLSIVKGCDLNGNARIVDYGRYASVTNMSTLDVPERRNDGVTWQLGGGANRFYYEVVPEHQTLGALPWTIDVGYKHNGVPAYAEALAGASGLITVEVTAAPNPKANAYYRDNFILVCGMTSDTGKNKSFTAPGAQFQTFGSYQLAFFITMPKREGNFTFEIGSDSFETPGVILTMLPVTLSQLDDLSEMKAHRANLEDAGRAIDATTADILDMLSAMSGGMRRTVSGLNTLDQARAAIDKDSDGVTQGVSKLRGSLKELEKGLNNYAEFLGDADMSDSVSRIGDEVAGAAEDMGREVIALKNALVDLKTALQALGADSGDKAEQMRAFALALGNAQIVLNQVNLSNYQRYVDKIEAAVNNMSEQAAILAQNDDPHVYQAAMAAIVNESRTINTAFTAISTDALNLSDTIKGGLGGVSAASEEIEDLLEETSRVMDDVADLMKDTRGMLDSVDTLLSDSSDLLNEGAQVSIAGVTQMLNDLLGVLHKTEDLQANRQTVADIVRDEWRRLDDDFGLLDIDTAADKVSLTSVKNPPPRSLQIVLRTHEIELPGEENVLAAAQEEAQSTVGARIVRVFRVIRDGLAELFK